MLVLTRRIRESIVISDEEGNILATITVLDIKGGQVRHGIEALRRLHIDRQEIFEKKLDEVNDPGPPAEISDHSPHNPERRFRRG